MAPKVIVADEIGNKDDIEALTFSEASLDKTAKDEFDVVMAQAQVVAEKYMANALEKLGQVQ